jgi:hypothetical protein
MNLSPIDANRPTRPDADASRITRKATPEKGAAPRPSVEAAATRGLVAEIGQRLAKLRAQDTDRRTKVSQVLREMREGKLGSRADLEDAAETMLLGVDPEELPGE